MPEPLMTVPPQRIQRKRTLGWRLPENTAIVDRTTKWGNPFIVNPRFAPGTKSGMSYINVPTLEDAVECYRLMLVENRPDLVADAQKELRGKNLACWCKRAALCHASVLLEIANAPLICEAV